MKFVEITGETLAQIVNDDEIHADDLVTAGVTPKSIIRINEPVSYTHLTLPTKA